MRNSSQGRGTVAPKRIWSLCLLSLAMTGCVTTLDYPYNAHNELAEGNYAVARTAYQEYVDKGDTELLVNKARYNLAAIYLYGLGVKADPAKAASYFQSITSNSFEYGMSQNHLARLYMQGLGVEKDIDKAITLYTQSNIPASKAELAILYWDGEQVEKDRTKAMSYLSELDTWHTPNIVYSDELTPQSIREQEGARVKGFPYFHALAELSVGEPAMESISTAMLMRVPKREAQAEFDIAEGYLKQSTLADHLEHAEDWIKRSAEKEYAPAQYLYARIQLFGPLKPPPSYDTEWIELLKASAKKNNPNAMQLLAELYVWCTVPEAVNLSTAAEQPLEGWKRQCKQNKVDSLEQAQTLLRKLVDDGNKDALTNLRFLYQRSDFKAVEKHLDWYHELAKQKKPEAYAILGGYYLTHQTAQSNKKALYWLEKAAKKDNRYAIAEMIPLMFEGRIGIEKNTIQSIKWLKKADRLGDKNAAFVLGNVYASIAAENPQYQDTSINWYKKAARKGDTQAMVAIANIYLSTANEKNSNQKEGVKWLQAATHKGDLAAKHQLADIYIKPDFEEGTRQKEAVQMYRELVEKDDMQAAYHLGTLYQRSGSRSESIKWFKIAADKDHLYAQNALAKIYDHTDNAYGAIQLREKIAQRDTSNLSKNEIRVVAFNQYKLGLMYQKRGQGDMPQSIKWLTKAAELDNHYALAHLGLLYYEGELVAKDLDAAYHWLTRWQRVVNKAVSKAKENSDSVYAEFQVETIHSNRRAKDALLKLEFMEFMELIK